MFLASGVFFRVVLGIPHNLRTFEWVMNKHAGKECGTSACAARNNPQWVDLATRRASTAKKLQ